MANYLLYSVAIDMHSAQYSQMTYCQALDVVLHAAQILVTGMKGLESSVVDSLGMAVAVLKRWRMMRTSECSSCLCVCVYCCDNNIVANVFL